MTLFRPRASISIRVPKTERGKAFIAQHGPLATLRAGEVWLKAREAECAKPAK